MSAYPIDCSSTIGEISSSYTVKRFQTTLDEIKVFTSDNMVIFEIGTKVGERMFTFRRARNGKFSCYNEKLLARKLTERGVPVEWVNKFL